MPSRGGRCYWVPWGPTTESARANLCDPTVKQADEDKKSPNGCYGGGGHTKTFLGAKFYTQTHSGRRVLVDEVAGQICLQAGNTNRRQQLLGSEDSLGHQQGAEDAEWPSLTRVEGTRKPWLTTSLEEGTFQTETRSWEGPSPDVLEGRNPPKKTKNKNKTKTKTKTKQPEFKGIPSEGGEQWPMRVCYSQNRFFTHLRHYGRATNFGTVWCCPYGS